MAVGHLPLDVITNSKGTPELPDERFANASQVRDLAQQMIRADQRRAYMRERVDALVNGFPTYPKSVTASKGMGWLPRVNYREAEGMIQSQQTPLFDLISEVDRCIEIELDDTVVPHETEEQLQDFQDSIAKNWTWMLFKRWRKSFNYHLPLSQREMLVHGMGAHVWPNKFTWVPRTPRSGQILFPEACSLDFESEGKYFMLRDFVPGEDVYSFIRNEQSAKDRGWFPDNVWKTLVNAQKQNIRPTSTAPAVEELQRKVRRGDFGYWASSQVGLWLNWMFVKEYTGGVSLYCIEEAITCGNKDGGYLFKKRFEWDDWNDVLVLFPIDVGNGDIHSVRGYGWRTKDFFELSNRVNNAMVAQVLISAFPQFSQTTNGGLDPEKIRLFRAGAMNIWPYGLKAETFQFPQLSNTGLALQQHLKSTMESNNQSMSGSTPEPKDRETKYSFQVRAHDSASVTNGMQSLYESNYQQFQDTMYRRAIKTPKGDLPYQAMVQEFKDRCLKDGVPPEALTIRAIGQIRERTSAGAGSAAIRLQVAQLLLDSPVYLNAPEDKKIAMERFMVANTMGQVNVSRFARSVTDTDLPDQDESLAAQESNGLSTGGDAIIGVRQDDVAHATNHLQKAQQHMQMCEAGQEDPAHCLDALQRLLNHSGEHLHRLQNNPVRKQQFDQLEAQWNQIAQYAKTLQNQVESQQGQPSPQQQLSEDGQIKMAKVQQDSQIKSQKAQADIALKFRKAAFTERIHDAQTGSGIHRENLKTATAIHQDNVKTGAQIAQDQAKTVASVNAKTAANSRNGRGNETLLAE